MAKNKDTDSITLSLINEIERQKEEISKAERPSWTTNCAFSYTENPSNAVNIRTEANIRNLICMAAFLKEKEKSYNEAAKELGIDNPPKFTWSGSSVADWLSDFKLRITKIQISTKKKKLESLETLLNVIISPELRAQRELEAIKNELG